MHRVSTPLRGPRPYVTGVSAFGLQSRRLAKLLYWDTLIDQTATTTKPGGEANTEPHRGNILTCGQASGQRTARGGLCKNPVRPGTHKCYCHHNRKPEGIFGFLGEELALRVARLRTEGATMREAGRFVGITKNQVVNLERSSRFAELRRRLLSDSLARREVDLEPVGALMKTGPNRWCELYGPALDSQPKPPNPSLRPDDPSELVERARRMLLPALRSGRLLDEAILGYGPVASLNEGFFPPARYFEDLLERLSYVPKGATYAWIDPLLASLQLGSIEAEIDALFGGLKPLGLSVVRARREPGRPVPFERVVRDLPLAVASAWRLQRDSERTILARFAERPYPRLRGALILADRLAASSERATGAPPPEGELAAVLSGELRKRGMEIGAQRTEDVLLLRRLLAPAEADLSPTLAWARTNLAASPSLDDLVGHSGFSKPVFLARFREATGTSPKKWLAERKVEEAKRLLERNAPLPEIARACGFRSKSAFRETFHRHTGLSPKQYQVRYRRPGPASTTPPSPVSSDSPSRTAAAALAEPLADQTRRV